MLLSRRGFTLIEMMIVVGIIAILVAIALPNFMRSRVQTNEAQAIENLRVIGSAQVSYHASHNGYGSWGELRMPAAGGPPYLSGSWDEGFERGGYTYSMPEVNDASFVCIATPTDPGVTGTKYFRVDGSGIIRFSTDGEPEDTDTPIGSG
jgi:prepilin-type N-terminal cleavage/methylation domain-containing protein